MAMTSLVFKVAETTSTGVNPYLVGGTLLLVFLGLMAALLAFGAGRDHS